MNKEQTFKKRDAAYHVPGTRCGNGQSCYDAAKEKWGVAVMVDYSRNAYHFMPNSEQVKEFGNPIGQVTLNPHEQFYVFRLFNN